MKRLVCLMACIMLLSSVNVFAKEGVLDFSKGYNIYGDVDYDDRITSKDAAIVLQYVLNSDSISLNIMQREAADVLDTGDISASDASNILAKALNQDHNFVNETQLNLFDDRYDYLYKTAPELQDIRTMENYGVIEYTSDVLVVKSGEVYDGRGKTLDLNYSATGIGIDIGIYLEDGATIKNVIIQPSQTVGISVEGNATIENVHWEDSVGPGIKISSKDSQVDIIGCSFVDLKQDAIRYAYSTNINMKDCYFYNINGEAMAQTGGFSYGANIDLENIYANTIDSLLQTDSQDSKITYKNLDIKNQKNLWVVPNENTQVIEKQ